MTEGRETCQSASRACPGPCHAPAGLPRRRAKTMTRGAGGSGHAHAPWHGSPLSQQASAPRLSQLSTLNARPAALWRCAHAAAALAALAAAPSAAVQKRASARGNAPARCADASRAAWPRQGELRRVLDSVRRAAVDAGRAFVYLSPRSLVASLLAAPQEKPRDPIDLRGRLDSKGVRYGKVIDFKCARRRVPRFSSLCSRYRHSPRTDPRRRVRPGNRMSELRVIELLDGLCEPMVNYALWTPSAQWITANPDADHERRWVRISGAGADVQGATGACPAASCVGWARNSAERRTILVCCSGRRVAEGRQG